MKASKQFYTEKGLKVDRSFGSKCVEFTSDSPSSVKLALYNRIGLANDLGVTADGEGLHRIVLSSSTGELFTDPDGFDWAITTGRSV